MRICNDPGRGASRLQRRGRVIADGRQIVVPVAHCSEIVGSQITVEPAHPLRGRERVNGIYRIVG
jgi:hypothetical protein